MSTDACLDTLCVQEVPSYAKKELGVRGRHRVSSSSRNVRHAIESHEYGVQPLESRILLSALSEFVLSSSDIVFDEDGSPLTQSGGAGSVDGVDRFNQLFADYSNKTNTQYIDIIQSGQRQQFDSDLLYLANTIHHDSLKNYDRVDSALLRLHSRLRRDGNIEIENQRIHGTKFTDTYLTHGQKPAVMIHVDHAATAAQPLRDLGVDVFHTYSKYGYEVISAWLDLNLIDEIAELPFVRSVSAAPFPYAEAQGAATNQAEFSTFSDQVKRLFPGLDGSGIDVGIISDSINRRDGGVQDSIDSGDLPSWSRIEILDDFLTGSTTDEGRGMAELMYDIGPGFDFLFHTGSTLPFLMAGGIEELADSGADIIVDDISHYTEPVFQDGVISQAIDDAYLDHGVLHFGSAGNAHPGGYNEPWSDPDDDGLHNFAPNDERLTFTMSPGARMTVALHWSQPHTPTGVLTDLDIEITDSSFNIVADSNIPNIAIASVDLMTFTNDSESTERFGMQFRETLFTSADGLDLYLIVRPTEGTVTFEDGYTENEPSISGNHSAHRSFTIGASRYDSPNTLEPFSSYGPVVLQFSDSGNELDNPITRQKPDFVGFDGADTSFFGSTSDFDNTGFPNFFGTSAAAPNVAAVAGLLLDQAGGPDSLNYIEMRNLLRDFTTGPTAGSGWDFRWGYGQVNALGPALHQAGPHSPETTIEFGPFGSASQTLALSNGSDIDVLSFIPHSTANIDIDVTSESPNLDAADFTPGQVLTNVLSGVRIQAGNTVDVASRLAGTIASIGWGTTSVNWTGGDNLNLFFDGSVSSVSVDLHAGGTTSIAKATLFLLDENDNVLQSKTSEDIPWGSFQTLSIQRPRSDVARAALVIPGEPGDFRVRYNNISYGTTQILSIWDNFFGDHEHFAYADGSSTQTHSEVFNAGKSYQIEILNMGDHTQPINYTVTLDGPVPAIHTLTPNLFGDTSSTGQINIGDADYYRVTTPSGTFTGDGWVRVTPSNFMDTVLTIYDDTGNIIERVDDNQTGGTESFDFSSVPSGQTYFFRIGARNNATSGGYNFAVNFDSPPVPNGTIRGTKFNDLDGDGIQDTGEPGLGDWVVYLDQNQNDQLDSNEVSTLTDSNGDYEFTGLDSGTYFVAEVQQSGWIQTLPASNYAFEAGTLRDWSSIGDVKLERSPFGVNPTEGRFMARLTTGLGAVDQSKLETFGSFSNGALDGTPSGNAREGSMLLRTITAEAGAQVSFDWNFLTNASTPSANNDFAFWIVSFIGLGGPPAVVADTNDIFASSATVYNEETGWNTESVTLNFGGTFLLKIGIVDEDTTAQESALLVDNLRIQNPSGDPKPGQYRTEILGPGNIKSGLDFGNRIPTTTRITGTKFNDLDGDGVQDPSDISLPNATIYLDANHNGRLDEGEQSTLTDLDGNYEFTNVLPGVYSLAEIIPDGWTQSFPQNVDDAPSLVITEVGLGSRDYIEIQNLAPHDMDTTGWQVIVSDSYANQNVHNPNTWLLPDRMRSGQVAYRTDNPNEQYWGDNLLWNNGRNGWAAIIDNHGAVVDYVGWGWLDSEIEFWVIHPDPFINVGIDSQWTGASVPNNGSGSIQRRGATDTNTASDWIWLDPPSKGQMNLDLRGPAYPIEVFPQQQHFNLDFHNTRLGEIRGHKFHDINGNGIKEPTEPGLGDWTIYIDENSNRQFDNTPLSLEPDDFTSGSVIRQSGLSLSAIGSDLGINNFVTSEADSDASTGSNLLANNRGNIWFEDRRILRVDFAQHVSQVTIDFISDDDSDFGQLNAYDASDRLIGQYFTQDLGNGQSETMIVDVGEPAIAYIHAFGIGNQAGKLDNLTYGKSEPSIRTDASGDYLFDNLPIDRIYEIREVLQNGWAQQAPVGGSHTVRLNLEQPIATDRNFGNSRTGVLTGTKYHDQNANGSRDPGEPSLSGWTIYLDQNQNAMLDLHGFVEPDDYEPDDIEGVSLAAVGPSETYPVQSIVSSDASTGNRVFGFDNLTRWSANDTQFRADFDSPVSSVSVDFISQSTIATGIISAYAANDQLVAQARTSLLRNGEWESMTINRHRTDIKYIIASGVTTSVGSLDNLVYGNEPIAITREDGSYRFDSLPAGISHVREIQQPGWLQTAPLGIIESFEDNDVSNYIESVAGQTAISVDPTAAHDGSFGLIDADAPGAEAVAYRTDSSVNTKPGDRITVWINMQFAAVPGRAHFFFGVTPTDAYSVVLAKNTSDLILMRHPNLSTLSSQIQTLAVSEQSFAHDRWYLLNIDWGLDGQITASVFDSDGTTLINSITANDNNVSAGGIGFRAFGGDAWYDTITVNEKDVHFAQVLSGETATDYDFGNYQYQPPDANAGGPYTIVGGQNVTLNASDSFDPDEFLGDSIVSYEWDLDNDGDFDDATGPKPTIFWATLKGLNLNIANLGQSFPTNTITLRITDTSGQTSTDMTSLTIRNTNPTIKVIASPTLDQGESYIITNRDLLTTDIEHDSNQLKYEVTLPPSNGQILVRGRPSGFFTQAHIDVGFVQYVHDGGPSVSDAFRFRVTDSASGSSEPAQMSFTVNPVLDPRVEVFLIPYTTNREIHASRSLPTSDLDPFFRREGSDLFLEVWTRAEDVPENAAIRSGGVALTFDPNVTPFVAIEHGKFFDASSSTYSELTSASQIRFGGATDGPGLGDDEYILLARLLFDTYADIDPGKPLFGPFDPSLKLLPDTVPFQLTVPRLVVTDIQPVPDVSIRAIPYDFDNNGVVNFADLGFFLPAMGVPVDQSGDPPYATWADFDGDDNVGQIDFKLIMAAFGKALAEIAVHPNSRTESNPDTPV